MSVVNKNAFFILGITIFAVMGVATLSPALPQIIATYKLEEGEIKWLISIFTIPGIFLSPVAGILADRFGRKQILIPSLIIFALGGFLCTLSRSYHVLLLFRLLQGFGAAALGSLSITLVGDFFEGKNRITMMGINASVLSVAVASYPAIGGLLAAIEWHYVFYLPVLALILAVLLFFFLDSPIGKQMGSFTEYFSDLWRVINHKNVWGLFIVNLLVFIILYGTYITFFALLLKSRFNASSVVIGMTMSAMSLVAAVFSSLNALVNRWLNVNKILIISSVLYMIAMLIFYSSYKWLTIGTGIFLFGMGHGLLVPNMQIMLISKTSEKERAAFMSFSGTILRFGQFLGPLIISLFYMKGNVSNVYIAGAAFSLVILVVVLTMLRD